MSGTALILGANGRFGSHAAAAFWNACWHVKIFERGRDDLIEEARGADVIVNGWNPGYPDWARAVPQITEAVIEAAAASGATVILPGNVYVFGEDAPARLGAATPHAAENPLGQVRAEMEAAYRSAGVQTIVLRAGDFLDTEASGNWFDKVIARAAPKGWLEYPGPLDAPHAWAYLPDLARAAVALAERRAELPAFTDVPFPGYTLTGQEIAQAAAAALGRPIEARQMCWLPIKLARPVWPLARYLVEMRYLWSKPHWLDGAHFDALVPDFVPTPVPLALRRALQHQIHPDKPMAGGAVASAA
ncbi:MAG: epimerase [Pseudomonadota bacterium]